MPLSSSDHDIIPMAYHPCIFVLNFFSKQICNVEALICHFYKNIKTLTQIHFPRDTHIFRTCTIFYRHYKGLHQMGKDLVLCAHADLLFIKSVVVEALDDFKCRFLPLRDGKYTKLGEYSVKAAFKQNVIWELAYFRNKKNNDGSLVPHVYIYIYIDV